MSIKPYLILSAVVIAGVSCKPRQNASALRAGEANEGDDSAFVASCSESRLYASNDKAGAIALTGEQAGFGLADNDAGASAHAAFERNCTGECHTKRTSSGRLGDVTNYTIALKFRSEIKKRIEQNLMPPQNAPQPSEADRATMLSWAADPQPFPGQGGVPPLKSSNSVVGYRDDDTALDDSLTFVSPQAQIACIKADYARVPSIDRPYVRYVSFTHLYNAGIRKKDWAIMKKAFYKALNSVSRSSVIKSSGAIAIDSLTMTLFRIDLRAFKISPETWDSLPEVTTSAGTGNPYSIGRGYTPSGAYASGKYAELPSPEIMPVRGDHLMREMLQRKKYYDLLGISGSKDIMDFYSRRMSTGAESFSLAELRNSFDAKRAVFNDSPVNNGGYRVVEKVETGAGLAFNLFDFDRAVEADDPRRDPTIAPLGPCFDGAREPFASCSSPNKWTFSEDVTETAFQLQNGLFAFAVFDRQGKLADENKVTVDPINVEHKNVSGLSCISCHDVGLIPFKDAVGNQARKDMATKIAKKYYGEVTDVVGRIHPEPEDFNDYINEANRRYYTALGTLGIAPAEIQPEPIALVVSDFEKPLTRKRAAAEMGVSEDELVAAIQANDELRSTLAVFLNNQSLARDQWQDRFLANMDQINAYFYAGTTGSAGSNYDKLGGTPGTNNAPSKTTSEGYVNGQYYYKGKPVECTPNQGWTKFGATCDKAASASRNNFICQPCGTTGWLMKNLETGARSTCYAKSTPTICILTSSKARPGGVCIPDPNTSSGLRWVVFKPNGKTSSPFQNQNDCNGSL